MRKYLVCLFALFSISAQDVLVVTDDGEFHELNVDLNDSFGDILDRTALVIESTSLAFIVPDFITRKAKKESFKRDYNQTPSVHDKKDIAYIIKTLAWAPLPKLMTNKSSLQKAGDRIRPVHPLRFLEFVFTNEELKAGIHAIRNRTTFVWSEFWGGLRDSLEEEAKIGNLNAEQIANFSQNVGVATDVIAVPINARHWQDFFDLLLQLIPRSENADRYNM